jgi:hypothetical protein
VIQEHQQTLERFKSLAAEERQRQTAVADEEKTQFVMQLVRLEEARGVLEARIQALQQGHDEGKWHPRLLVERSHLLSN